MAHLISIDLDDVTAHLVDPPVVDLVVFDRLNGCWNVTFVPEASVSLQEKETISFANHTALAKRVQTWVQRLNELFKADIVRIVHSGGGEFTFFFSGNDPVSLSHAAEHDGWIALETYRGLQDIAMTAQLAFIQSTLPSTKAI